jgi:ABC-type branched-subunit amino acid transport system ATPase component
MLSFFNVSKRFGGVKAVDHCSFSVSPHRITALIGPNGAGKSTAFNLISGVFGPDEGKISFEGADITDALPHEIARKGISRMFQRSSLFLNLTVMENLMLAGHPTDASFWASVVFPRSRENELEKKALDALRLVGMSAIAHKTCGELSFGQRRLVELARCLMSPHSFLMLDEPVGGVNPVIRKQIARLLIDLKAKGETVLLIEHDMSFTLSIADRVIVLDEGKVIAEGTPSAIKKDKKVLEAYLGE